MRLLADHAAGFGGEELDQALGVVVVERFDLPVQAPADHLGVYARRFGNLALRAVPLHRPAKLLDYAVSQFHPHTCLSL